MFFFFLVIAVLLIAFGGVWPFIDNRGVTIYSPGVQTMIGKLIATSGVEPWKGVIPWRHSSQVVQKKFNDLHRTK